ncbi:lysine--tRNA ligase [Modestobacter sp. I12A-02628]|uniref:Lysine--tRNA ligase n=1 Tax=Goekera deserti TaxID=2497753 RepID=A0A7K3WKW7_9ACTN|nr:lysine--tRNA ligase [Goekera deserti]MPQ98179.1 lysine--tRNA ligase [Goekera deserti]NDI48828.1 lysine--tRNA ligase [Goekera deserti]NEL56509.1 lysine--tRNA ligase [Goekera deserti]
MIEEPPGPTDDELPEQVRVRRAKLDRLRGAGVDPYPVAVARTTSLAQVRAAHPDLEPDTMTGETVGVTGRVIFSRNTGKLCFATLREGGTELQVMLSRDRVGEEQLAAWKADVDLGDHVLVTGEVGTSRRGELSVFADSWQLAAKALRPLPVAHKPMSEELRVRRRYVDLIVRDEARRTVHQRATVMSTLRAGLTARSFLEVETPMLQNVHGGATARPFRTHMNAFDLDLYLRIAPELFLKRCIVGGLDRVFEINRNFRNEGADSSHSPEFAMLEAYAAYWDYQSMATMTRELVQESCVALFGDHVARHHDGTELDLSGVWPQVPLYGAVSEAVGEEVTPETPVQALRALAERHEVGVDPAWSPGKVVEELFEALVQHTLQSPTFVVDYPLDTSPLTRAHRTTPGLAEKWDLYIGGIEQGTAYSELVDPVAQRERFTAQALLAAAGDPEAMALDEDFLEALEYGMPPTGGMGFGMDRLMMTLTGLGIRETILFPLVRPLTPHG